LIDKTRVWNTFSLLTNGTFQYYISDTITLNDTIHHKLFSKSIGAYEGELLGYIREDSTKKVFFKNVNYYPGFGEKLLYDFGLKIKDSIDFINFYEGYAAWVIVDTIKIIELDNGEQRKLWEFKYTSMQHPYVIGQWIEGIGSISTELLIPSFVHTSTNETYLLCCFEDNELVYKREGYDSCEILLPYIEEKPQYNISIYPNPAKDLLHVKIDVPQLEEKTKVIFIHDISGTGIINEKFTKNEHTVSLKNIPAGIYTAFIMCEGQILKTEKIVVVK
jgi:hypothetical protein